jgi:hypothetical protein
LSPTASTLLPTLLLVPLVGFALYRRLKGSFGRQPLIASRMIVRIVLFAAICAFFLASSPLPSAVLAAGVGLTAGVGLAFVGLRHTTVERTAKGSFYTPNKWLGLVVTALFVGRLGARLIPTLAAGAGAGAGVGDGRPPAATPLTFGLLYLMAGYYVAYYVGVLLRERALGRDDGGRST